MVRYSKNAGTSIRDAVRITGAGTHRESVMAEYRFIEKDCQRNKKQIASEDRQQLKVGSRYYHVYRLAFSDGSKGVYFFDITEPRGKFVIYPQ